MRRWNAAGVTGSLRAATAVAVVLLGAANGQPQGIEKSAGGGITADLIRSEIARYEMATDPDAETRAKIIERYKSALAEIARLDNIAAKDAQLRQEAKTVAERAQKLQADRLAIAQYLKTIPPIKNKIGK